MCVCVCVVCFVFSATKPLHDATYHTEQCPITPTHTPTRSPRRMTHRAAEPPPSSHALPLHPTPPHCHFPFRRSSLSDTHPSYTHSSRFHSIRRATPSARSAPPSPEARGC